MSNCNDCNDTVTSPPAPNINIYNSGDAATMINVGSKTHLYKDVTANPFELKTLGIDPKSNAGIDKGFKINTDTPDEVNLSYNPLRGRTLFVDAAYGEVQGVALREHEDCSYINLLDAVDDALSGDTIIVYPGIYDISADNRVLIKDGVNIYCHPNTHIYVSYLNGMINSSELTYNTGLYGYAELYITDRYDIYAVGPVFTAGVALPPSATGSPELPILTIEINNLIYTNPQNTANTVGIFVVKGKCNLIIRENIYSAGHISLQTGVGDYIEIVGNDHQINLTFKDAYSASPFRISKQFGAEKVNVNVTFSNIFTEGYIGSAPVTYVISITNSVDNTVMTPYHRYQGIKIKGRIVNEFNVYPLSSAISVSGTGVVDVEFEIDLYQNCHSSPIRLEGRYNNIRFKNSRIFALNNDVLFSPIILESSGGVGIVTDNKITFDDVTIICTATSGLPATVYLYKGFSGTGSVELKIIELKTNISLPVYMYDPITPLTPSVTVGNYLTDADINQ